MCKTHNYGFDDMEAICELILNKHVSTAKHEQSIKSKSKEIACLGAEGPAACGG